MDPKLASFVKSRPHIRYRRSSSLQDQLVNSHHDSKSVMGCCRTKSPFQCGHCNICTYLSYGATIPSFLRKCLVCPHYVDCTTKGVIYLWLCECGNYYVGKTLRAFKIRIKAHLYASKICDLLSPIGRHRALHHEYRPIRMLFTALDHVHVNSRGDYDKRVLQREAQWIFRFDAYITIDT